MQYYFSFSFWSLNALNSQKIKSLWLSLENATVYSYFIITQPCSFSVSFRSQVRSIQIKTRQILVELKIMYPANFQGGNQVSRIQKFVKTLKKQKFQRQAINNHTAQCSVHYISKRWFPNVVKIRELWDFNEDRELWYMD